MIACEIIAKYRDGRVGADAFKRLLPCDERCQKMGKKLYEALRNGLVHGYDTQDILVGSRRIGLAIAWRDTPHLSVMRSGAKPCLVLNIQDLFDRLSTEIDAFRRELESQAGPRDRFFKTFGQNKDVRVEQDGEVQAWLSLINESPAVASSGLLH